MENLSSIGRIFYGIAMAAMGFLTIYFGDLPYMLIPPGHVWLNDHSVLVDIAGILLCLAGAGVAFKIKPRTISLLLGGVLLVIFCFYFIPYQFLVSSNYRHFGEWENAAKELALASGALVIATCFPEKSHSPFFKFLGKLAPMGLILFSLTILSFGVDHFLFAKEAEGYIPSWVPYHLFWMYFTGSALLGSAAAIILGIQRKLAATLLGTMIFIWVLILHIPKAVASPIADMGGEVSSGFLALAYCGIAFVIAGEVKRRI